MTQELLTIARELRAQPPYSDYGICSYLTDEENEIRTRWRFQTLAEARPEYSGNPTYPVPYPGEGPGAGYSEARVHEMWSPYHPYGAARLRLLDFIIQQLEEEYPDA